MSKFISDSKSRTLLFVGTAMLICLAGCTESAAPVPDLSGQWGRDMLFFEPPPSGPSPILNTVLKADGTMDFNALVGDYTSPILKPEAADVLRRRGVIRVDGGRLRREHAPLS